MSLRTALVCSVAIGGGGLSADRVVAQQVAVQQPVVEAFGGSTTVSVPDRGQAHIGSISRGAASQSVYGPWRTNSSFGQSYSAGSTSVGVFIHDPDELDRQTLAAANREGATPANQPGGTRADRAYRWLYEQSHRPPTSRVARSPAVRPSTARRLSAQH